ncbi:MAG: ketosteroid isomerase-like protein [Gammaproteobacteria bacterium]
MTNRYAELKQLTDDFLGAFNRADVDGIMSFFTEDAVYEEFHGRVNEGKAAIRKSFERLYSDRFGTPRFEEDDTFIDVDQNKVMSSWRLYLDLEGEAVVIEGLDLLRYQNDKIVLKQTYAKAKVGLYEPV